jgi:nitrite reductase (cytochrome c-552)
MLALVVALAALATVAIAALLVNIFERKQEARNPFYRVVELNDTIDDPAVWGKNFPMQYDLYLRTVDMQRTRYGGSEAMPHSPTQADPRSVVARSKLQEDPRLKTIWAGYSFSADYRERRGHAYMLDDQTFTERQKFAPPAMCINCHASIVTTYLKLGNGDLMKGFNVISDTHMTYPQIRETMKHAVACIDCHDPATMQLRITRPAFIEGIRALKASQGIANYDVNAMATRQEMRSYVCGQCHVTYYFQPPNKRLTFPGRRESRSKTSSPGRTSRKSTSGRIPTQARNSSRPGTPNLKCGTRACTHARASLAPTATCPTCARADSRSATTRSIARC